MSKKFQRGRGMPSVLKVPAARRVRRHEVRSWVEATETGRRIQISQMREIDVPSPIATREH